MNADRAGKFDATSCGHYQDYERAMCLACANKALREAFEAGVEAGLRKALAVMWCPPNCNDPQCDQRKVLALLEKGRGE